MKSFVRRMLTATAFLAVAAAPAAAQVGLHVGPGGGGVYIDRDYDRGYDRGYHRGPDREYRHQAQISRREAIRIARRNGLAEIYDVQQRRAHWVVRGESYRGRDLTVRVHMWTGDVTIIRR